VTVKHEGFKTCDQSGFCRRNRAYADNATTLSNTWNSPYAIDSRSVQTNGGQFSGTILKSLGEGIKSVQLPIKITFLESGAARVTVDELKRQQKDIELRHGSQVRKERYNEASSWALVASEKLDTTAKGKITDKETIVEYGPNNRYRAVIYHTPFSIDFFRDNAIQVKFNGNGFLNMEHWRPKIEKAKKELEESKEGEESQAVEEPSEEGEDESTWWEETFGGNTDSKPRGPESVGLDIVFPGYEHVYGIPGHASSLSLKQTRYDEPQLPSSISDRY